MNIFLWILLGLIVLIITSMGLRLKRLCDYEKRVFTILRVKGKFNSFNLDTLIEFYDLGFSSTDAAERMIQDGYGVGL